MEEKNIKEFCIINLPYRSKTSAILLGLFLGPIGLVYSNTYGAIGLTILFFYGLITPFTHVGYTIVISSYLISIFWNAIATENYNQNLLKLFTKKIQ